MTISSALVLINQILTAVITITTVIEKKKEKK